MRNKVLTTIMLFVLSISMLTLAFNVDAVEASGNITIMADGTVDPSSAPILRDGDLYTFTAAIYDTEIVVQKDDIVLDGAGYTLEGTGGGTGIDLSERENVLITNLKIINFGYGIYLQNSNSNIIYVNTIKNNDKGVFLEALSPGVTNDTWVIRNNITDNYIGIDIGSLCTNNLFFENNITENNFGVNIHGGGGASPNMFGQNNITKNSVGVCLQNAVGTVVFRNNITENGVGVKIEILGGGNMIFHNNFIDNNVQASAFPLSLNLWDGGYPSGGNYWSDYTGTDANGDGIGDTPYTIAPYNVDRYPLMIPWVPQPSTPLESLEELIETIETMNLPNGIENSLTAKLENAINQLDKGNENSALGMLTAFINEVEALRGKKLSNEQADQLTSEAQRIIDLIQE